MNDRPKWRRVSRQCRCPICGHDDYCTIATDGSVVHCMRIQSEKSSGGALGGWVHPNPDGAPPPEPVRKSKPVKIADVSALAMSMFHAAEAAAVRLQLAKDWNVDRRVLESLLVGVGYDNWNGRKWASFPSRSANGTIIGITRRYPSGEKKTLAGTSNGGVFAVAGWWQSPGHVFVCEGASDLAVLLNAGLCAIARPSNLGGADIIRTMLARRAPGRKVVVLGENDRKPDRVGDVAHGCRVGCDGCNWCWPGKFGATAVANRLGGMVVMPPDGIKDVRVWNERDPRFSVKLVIDAVVRHGKTG